MTRKGGDQWSIARYKVSNRTGMSTTLHRTKNKNQNPPQYVLSTPSFRFQKPWIHFGEPFEEIKVSDRVSETCIVVPVFWLVKNISFFSILSQFPHLYNISTYNYTEVTMHIFLKTHTKQILYCVNK